MAVVEKLKECLNGNTWLVRLMVEIVFAGAASALTTTILALGVSAEDTTNSVHVDAGDTVVLSHVGSSGDFSAYYFSYRLLFTPD